MHWPPTPGYQNMDLMSMIGFTSFAPSMSTYRELFPKIWATKCETVTICSTIRIRIWCWAMGLMAPSTGPNLGSVVNLSRG
ncbi:hypothetical protein AB3S75_011856 [Citrus x aurantiifolia]